MKLNFVTPTLVLIILALLFYLFNLRSQSKIDRLEQEIAKKQWSQQVEAKTAEILTRDSLIRDLQRSAIERRGKDSLALEVKERANSALARKLAEKRPPIEAMADTIQPLRDYLVLADSLLASKDTLIVEMSLRHSAQVVELNEIIDLHAKQALSKDAVIELMEKRNADLEKKNRKLTRGKGFRNVVIGVLTAGIVYISLRE